MKLFRAIVGVFALAFLATLTACSTMQSGGPVDENILITLPLPGSGWTFRDGEKGGDSVMMWVKTNEYFKISIMHGRIKPEPESMKSGMDSVAREKFTLSFESKELKTGLVNNYPMVLWQTKATLNDGARVLSLLLYVKGNDATYLVQKRWNYPEVPDTELKTWIDYMSAISVCDNRYPEHRSPKMEEQLPGIYYRTGGTNSIVH